MAQHTKDGFQLIDFLRILKSFLESSNNLKEESKSGSKKEITKNQRNASDEFACVIILNNLLSV